MSQLSLSQLVQQLGARVSGGHRRSSWCSRAITPLFIFAPLFSSKMLPARVRGIVAVALSIGLTGVAMHGQHVPSDPMSATRD